MACSDSAVKGARDGGRDVTPASIREKYASMATSSARLLPCLLASSARLSRARSSAASDSTGTTWAASAVRLEYK